MLTVSAWQKKMAFYAASLLRQGNFVDAGFVSATLFEKIMEKELALNGLPRPEGAEFIFNAIERLSRKNPKKYNSGNLHALRRIIEKHVIHKDEAEQVETNRAERELVKAEIARLVTYVWQVLDLEKFIRYRTIGAIPLTDADNAVMEVREFFQDDQLDFTGIPNRFEEQDFNDLVQLRLHLLNLAVHLRKLFLGAYRNLEVDVIGKVENASAYAMMAVNLIRPGQGQLMDHVHYAFVSVMATPLGLRISIDFGSEAYMSRGDWYDFLETDIFRSFATKQADLKIYDTEWYSFITVCDEACAAFADEGAASRINAARQLLSRFQGERKSMPWGRLIPGYFIGRGRTSYDDICRKLEKMVSLYYMFEKFRRDVLKRNNTLEWVPRGI